MPLTNGRGETFGHWLLAQRDRGDWVDQLPNAARKDPSFPMDGSAEDVRRHLRKAQAEGEWISA